MKTYGVNWFLVWVSLLIFLEPLYAWLYKVVFSHWFSPPLPPASMQAFGMSCCWAVFYYVVYAKTLADPKALERLRQSLQKTKGARKRRYRWLIAWLAMFAVVAVVSLIFRAIYNLPSWLHLVGYSVVVPLSAVASSWLLDKTAKTGQLARLLEDNAEAPS